MSEGISFDAAGWRKFCGLSQKEMAQLMGSPEAKVVQVEFRDGGVNATTLGLYAKALGVPRTVLLYSTPEHEYRRGWIPPEPMEERGKAE
jgi:transcriptional regulator with XRE-family HTH domain